MMQRSALVGHLAFGFRFKRRAGRTDDRREPASFLEHKTNNFPVYNSNTTINNKSIVFLDPPPISKKFKAASSAKPRSENRLIIP